MAKTKKPKAKAELALRLFIACHQHRHGNSIYPFLARAAVSESAVIDAFDIDFEPDEEEFLDIIDCGQKLESLRVLPVDGTDQRPDRLKTAQGEGFSHRYPVACSVCSADLRKAEAVRVIFSVDGHLLERRSQVDAAGFLEDVDGMIAKGLHSDSNCAGCGERLAEHEFEQTADD
jgi:hypothetical protein